MSPDRPVHLILGAAGGIGSVLCRQLREADAVVVPAGRASDRLDALASELGATARPLDATDFDAVERTVKEVADEHGRLDGVANLVGSILLKPAHRTSADEYRSVLSANLDTAFATVRAAGAAMRKGGGSIVLMSSAAGRLGLANHEAIAAAKAGVIGLGLSAAASYAKHGIRVNVVAPGLVRTPLSEPILRSSASEKASLAMHPLERLGEPEDVARSVAWLLDPAQSWVTGQVLGVDGGLGSVRSQA